MRTNLASSCRHIRFAIRQAELLILLGFMTSGASAATITLTCAADAYVDFVQPNANYGASQLLQVGGYGDPYPNPRGCTTYVGFPAGSIPSGSTVTRVKLVMKDFVTSSDTSFPIMLGSCDPFSESLITYNSKPTYGTAFGSRNRVAGSTTWTWDSDSLSNGSGLCSYVQARASNGAWVYLVLSFANSDYNTTWPAYYSREYTTSSLRPKLEVTYTPPAVLDSWDPVDDTAEGRTLLLPSGQANVVATHGPHTVGANDAEDWFGHPSAPGVGSTLTFESTGSGDTKAELYAYFAGSASLVASDDDSGSGSNFRISYVVSADNSMATYRLRVLPYSSGSSESYSLSFTWDYPAPTTTIAVTTTTSTTTSTTTTAPTQASTLLWEDFQAYSLDQWPSANWVADANATDVGNNKVSSAQGGKALQLYGQVGGCWGALAYRAVSFPTRFWVECDVYNGTEALSGCHPARGEINMRQGTYWANPARSLLSFTGGDRLSVDGQDIGGYQSGQWAHVKIGYARNGSTLEREYWLNGAYLTKITSSIADLGSEASLNHIELVVQEGSAWFDNLRVSTEGDTTYCPTGWTWFSWPYEYDYTTSQWWFYRASDTQWCYGFAPVNGWVRLGASGLASGFVYFSWPYAYDWEGGVWYWFNLGNTQNCGNLGTGEWRTLGR